MHSLKFSQSHQISGGSCMGRALFPSCIFNPGNSEVARLPIMWQATVCKGTRNTFLVLSRGHDIREWRVRASGYFSLSWGEWLWVTAQLDRATASPSWVLSSYLAEQGTVGQHKFGSFTVRRGVIVKATAWRYKHESSVKSQLFTEPCSPAPRPPGLFICSSQSLLLFAWLLSTLFLFALSSENLRLLPGRSWDWP